MIGGGQWSLYYMIKHLNKEIFHPIVLCPDEGELAKKMRRVGADVVCLKMGKIRYLNPLVIMRLRSIIREKEINIIHTDSSTETFYAGIAARMMTIPLIWHIRVNEGEWFLDRILSILSTRLILVAHAIRERFAWLKKSRKLVVVHNGVDLEEFDRISDSSSLREELNVNKDIVILGCFGRIERRKGQEYLIAAMQHINNAKLILVGSEDKKYLKRLKQLSEEFKVSRRIIFAGYRKDIPRILQEIDLLVFPTLSEGFSRVILEAMAAQKPVVATNVGGNSEAVVDGKTGYIVPSGDSLALAEQIKKLVADKKKRKRMGQAGRKRVSSMFTIQLNVEGIQEVYAEILQRGPV
jgi:glycosyltransferase involved in cell wall biosynthesis